MTQTGHELIASLSQALGLPASASYAVSAGDVAGNDDVARFRLALAVRDWVNPFDLVTAATGSSDAISRDHATAALEAIAPDVETAPSEKKGAWWLNVEARRRALVGRPVEQIREEVRAPLLLTDIRDPIHIAFRQIYGVETRELDWLTDNELHALEQVEGWLGNAMPPPLRSPEIARLLAARQRGESAARLTATPIFGREPILAAIEAQLGGPFAPAAEPKVVHVWGPGGVGKSTILALFEQQLLEIQENIVVVHLDFDRVDLDPFSPVLLDLELLRQLPLKDSNTPDLESKRQQLANLLAGIEADLAATSGTGVSVEAVSNRSTGERSSVMYNALLMLSQNSRPVALVFDTVEVIEARGQAAVTALTSWARSLVHTVGIHDLRILMAGRSPPSTGILWFDGTTPIELPDLSFEDAEAMLRTLGVTDRLLAASAAAALPRNPLVLKIASEVYRQQPEDLVEIRNALSTGSIDRVTASRYLAERIVKHVPDVTARSYALGAVLLPKVTPQLLWHVVMPAIDEVSGRSGEPEGGRQASRARRVFSALSRAGWLATPALDGRSFTYHPEVQKLILDLMRADPDRANAIEKVHRRAIRWHESRHGAADRAFAWYHQAILGDVVQNRLQ